MAPWARLALRRLWLGKLALRFGDPPGGSLIGRKLVETRILTVASPEFVARYGRPKHPSEVEKLRCIDFVIHHVRRRDNAALQTELAKRVLLQL